MKSSQFDPGYGISSGRLGSVPIFNGKVLQQQRVEKNLAKWEDFVDFNDFDADVVVSEEFPTPRRF